MTMIERTGIAMVVAAATACSAPERSGPVGVPVAIDVTENAIEFDVGSEVEFTVSLKSADGAPAIAPVDTPVALASPAMAPLVAVIKAGASSSIVHWRPDSGGVFRVTASADGLRSKATLVPVKGLPWVAPTGVTAREAKPIAQSAGASASRTGPLRNVEVDGLREYAAARDTLSRVDAWAGVSVPPVQVADEPVTLRMYIEPEPIDETDNSWTADISFMLQTATGALKAASTDIPIALTSRLGRISPNQVLLPAGRATSRATPVRLAANHAGEDRIRAASSIGSVEHDVRFRPALPAAIAVNVSPARIVSDGRSEATVSVRLVDSHKHAQRADDDLEVDLNTNVGKLKAGTIVIAKGTTAASTTISSTERGVATITAYAAGLTEGVGTIRFALPMLAVMCAVLGGVLGAFLRSGTPVRTRRRRFVENLGIGAVAGVAFWLILLFGALRTSSSVLPFNINVIPAANEAGALLLGVAGGWLGRRIFADKRANAV